MPIKAIFLDLGDLLLTLHRDRVKQKFRELGAQNVDTLFEDAEIKALYQRYEEGMTTQDFRDAFKRKLNLPNITDTQFNDAWNAMLGEIPQERLDFIRNLKSQGYEVFLLSNNNGLHYGEVQRRYGDVFNELFDRQYYSHHLQMVKPNQTIFEHVLRLNNLKPNEAFFADDRSENIETARSLGMHVMQTTVNRPVQELADAIQIASRLERYRARQTRIENCRQGSGISLSTAVGTGCMLAVAGLFLYNRTSAAEEVTLPIPRLN
jgi:epoxide hydrolase-like predicted phosphatase